MPGSPMHCRSGCACSRRARPREWFPIGGDGQPVHPGRIRLCASAMVRKTPRVCHRYSHHRPAWRIRVIRLLAPADGPGYLAKDEMLHRQVAEDLPPRRLPVGRRGVLRARAVAALKHNVVTVFQVGEHPGRRSDDSIRRWSLEGESPADYAGSDRMPASRAVRASCRRSPRHTHAE